MLNNLNKCITFAYITVYELKSFNQSEIDLGFREMKRLLIILVVILSVISCGVSLRTDYAPELSTDKIQSSFLGCAFGSSKTSVERRLKGSLDENTNTIKVQKVSFGGYEWDYAEFTFSGYDRLWRVRFVGSPDYSYDVRKSLQQRYGRLHRFGEIYEDDNGRFVNLTGGRDKTILIYVDNNYDVHKGTKEL